MQLGVGGEVQHRFRRAQRLDGYRLLFESAFAGIVLAAVARWILVTLEGTALYAVCGKRWWYFAPFAYSDSAALSLALAVCVPLLFNGVTKTRAKNWAIARSGDGLTRLLNEAATQSKLVSLTMGNMKWYVGYVDQVPNLVPQDVYLRLLPVMSGYRDRQTLQTVRTVFYKEAFTANPDADLSIVLPVSEIKSANLFDEDLYQDVFAADNNPSGRST